MVWLVVVGSKEGYVSTCLHNRATKIAHLLIYHCLLDGFVTLSEIKVRKGRKHLALRPQKPLRLIRVGEVGGSGIFISNTYLLYCHHQNDSALRWVVV